MSITPLGTLDRSSSTFRADCNTFFSTSLPTFSVEVEAARVEVVAAEASALAAEAGVAADAAAAASSAALAATYAGAIAWVSGTSYAIGDKRWSLINAVVYRRLTTGAGTTDPSLDTTNWAVYTTATPAQLVTGLVQLAIAGGAYALTNTTAQSAATNLCLYSRQFDLWSIVGTGSCTANAAMGSTGDMTMDLLSDTDATAGAAYFERTSMAVANDSGSHTGSVEIKASTAATSVLAIYFTGGSTVTSYATITWGATPSIVATNGTSPALIHLGGGIYAASLTAANNSSGNTNAILRIFPAGTAAGVTGAVYADNAQFESGTASTSRITTGSAAATRSSGVVAPSRLVLPASPLANDVVECVVSNGILTNVIDPNGQTLEGVAGPVQLDGGQPMKLQFINSTWKRKL